jgi:hypothetical protein
MRIWVDDVRPAPEGYFWCKTVEEAKCWIEASEVHLSSLAAIEVIDLDHDAGPYVVDGGDYIKILDWLEETGRRYPIRIHSANPVGVANMRRIIERNGWTEVK